MKHLVWVAAGLILFGCKSTEDTSKVRGEGLISYDREPPPGVETFPKPEWKSGDRFVFLRGGKARAGGHVALREDGGFDLVDEDLGLLLHLDAELRELGQGKSTPSELDVQIDPYDARYSWPLWVGKRWSCHFVRNAPNEPALPLIATYDCDALEDVTVPAGTFQCLRIWRTVAPAIQGNFIDRVTIFWYSPKVGNLVRRIDDGIVTELLQYQRQ